MANGQVFTSLPLKTDGFLGTEVFALAAPGTPGSSVSYGIAANDIFKIIGSLPVYPGHVPTTFSVGVYDAITGLPYQATIAEIAVLGGNVPTGGTTGQVLAKLSDADYDTTWEDFPTPPEPANFVLAGPVSGPDATATFRLLVGADLPLPAPTTLGGVKSLAAVTHQFLTSIGTDGAPTQAQPSFGDISGQATLSQLPTIASGAILSNITGGAAVPAENQLSAIMDFAFSSTRGSVLYRGVAGWAALGPGTAGQALVTGGAGADPSWSAGVVGTVTSVGLSVPATSIFGVTGSPVTTSGTLGLTTTGTSGGIPYFSSGSQLATSALLAANQLVLGGGAGVAPATLGSLGTTTQVLHGNAGGAPTWGAVSLTADVTGTLPVGNGGTGQVSFTAHGVILGNGSSALAIAGPGTAGQVFLSNGASADPAFGSISTALDLLGAAQGDLLYRGASGWVVLTPGTNGQVLQTGGPAADPSWTTVTGTGTVTSIDVSGGTTGLTFSGGPITTAGTITMAGTLGVANGGLALNAITAHALIIGNGTGTPALLAPSSTSGVPLISQGASSNPVYGTAVVAGGGTGQTTLTNHGVLLGQGTSAVAATSAGTSGQILKSQGASADPVFADNIATITYVIDGGGATITTGIKGDLAIPFGCVIQEWTLLGDQSGSIVIDIWMDTYANYPPTVADTITGSAKPTISTATKGQSSTLTGWTTAIPAGDTLRFNVDSVTSITRCTISLKVSKT